MARVLLDEPERTGFVGGVQPINRSVFFALEMPMADNICDFANSYMTFELRGVNSARINLDARCTCIDAAGGKPEEFVLICPCQGERMYQEKGLVQDPPFNFSGVFSRTHSHLIRHHADGNVKRDTVEKHEGRFDSVKIEVARFPKAVELTTDQAIVDATLRNLPLVARTEVVSADGRSRAVMEYPVTTMNVEPQKRIWQVDTGPVLFADFDLEAGTRIERMVPGFVVYNRRDYAEWTLRAPVKLPAGDMTYHFTGMRAGKVVSSLYSGLPL